MEDIQDTHYVVGDKDKVSVIAHADMMFTSPDDIWFSGTFDQCVDYAFLHNTLGPADPNESPIIIDHSSYCSDEQLEPDPEDFDWRDQFDY